MSKDTAVFCAGVRPGVSNGLPENKGPRRVTVSLQQRSKIVVQQTLSIIKPDGTERNLVGKIVSRFEEAGLRVVGM